MKQLIINWVFRAEGGIVFDAQAYTWTEVRDMLRHECAYRLWRIAPRRLAWLIDALDPFK